ncbi:MAG: nuclear transport factor 2 family protein [Actinomycetota bacterium]|nr:nuclear transport factor 2 family protein [Actinomycetota bacterium]
MGHPNEDLVRRYFQAAHSGDLDILDELFADDVVAHIVGTHSLSGDHQGKQAVFGFFGQLAERSGGTAQLRLREVLADDWFALALVEVAGQVADATIDGERAAVVFRLKDGRFIEFWSHHYDQAKMDAVWS